MQSRILLRLIAIAVLLPSTLGAGFWSMLGFGFVADALLRGEHPAAAALVLAALVAGWARRGGSTMACCAGMLPSICGAAGGGWQAAPWSALPWSP